MVARVAVVAYLRFGVAAATGHVKPLFVIVVR